MVACGMLSSRADFFSGCALRGARSPPPPLVNMLNFHPSPALHPPLSLQSPVLARALARVGEGVSAADMTPAARAQRLVLELEALHRVSALWDLGDSDAEGSSDDAGDVTSRLLLGVLLRPFADDFSVVSVGALGADAALCLAARAACATAARTLATARVTAAADAATAARYIDAAKHSAAAAVAAERAASDAHAALSAFSSTAALSVPVGMPAVQSPRVAGAAAPSAFNASSSVAAVAASSTEDVPPTAWPAPHSLVAPHTVGASSFSAALSCMARAPCLTTPSGVARLLRSYAAMHLGASTAGPHPGSLWQTSSLALLPVDAASPSLAAFSPSSFHPRPSTFHGLATLLESWYCASIEDAGTGAGASAGADMGVGAELASPLSRSWYGGCLSVPATVCVFEGFVQLLGAGGWTGFILCLYTDTDAHYVAFCRLVDGWYFFDPDFGIVMLQSSSSIPLLPPGIFSQALFRTLFRFRLPTIASDAVCRCFERKLAPSVSS